MFLIFFSFILSMIRDVIYEKLDPNSKLRIRKTVINNSVEEKSVPNVPKVIQSIPTPAPKSVPIIPKEQPSKVSTSIPTKPTTQQLTADHTTKKDDKSSKVPIRSPSPHPLRSDDIEYDERFSDEDEDEEEDDDDEEEEDEEDSVIDKEHWVIDDNKSTNKTNVKDFLKQEIQNQHNNTNILR